MSLEDGLAALNLESPPRVPRTEYSADTYHYPLMRRVTGMETGADSPPEERAALRRAFRRAWDYGLVWNVGLSSDVFGDCRHDMGHAAYAEGGGDRREARPGTRFREPEDVLAFDPEALFGIPDPDAARRRFEANYRGAAAEYPDAVHMSGVYVSCMSGLIELLGWDLLLWTAGAEPKGLGEAVDRYARWMEHHFRALAASDVPVAMVHDDLVWTSGAFVHPSWYRLYVFPALKRLIRPLRDAGKKVLFTSDGDYTGFFGDVAGCGAHGFVLEPCASLGTLAARFGRTHVIVGNADTRILLSGSREAIRGEVARCLDVGRGCPGFFMAVGNHIPANTPVESALHYNDCYLRMRDRRCASP